MMIYTSKIPAAGASLQGEEPESILALDEADEFSANGPVSYDLYAQAVDGMLIVRGTVSAELKAACSRCTQIFSTTATDSGFLRDFPAPCGTEEVDVTEDLREAILLKLPHFLLCSESCRGLCVQCGKNLNEGACGCSPEEDGSAWDALNKLKM
jgi:uncharacterized protein